jgi:hypothetical protein
MENSEIWKEIEAKKKHLSAILESLNPIHQNIVLTKILEIAKIEVNPRSYKD